MNWDQIEGKWKQMVGRVKEKWGRLTDDDLQAIGGRREQLVGKIQERYGIAREEAERQVEAFAEGFQSGQEATTHEQARRAGKA